MTTPVTSGIATTRHDRAALGVIATYLHELTDHGRPRERDEDAEHDERIAAGEGEHELAAQLTAA